MTMYTAIDLK